VGGRVDAQARPDYCRKEWVRHGRADHPHLSCVVGQLLKAHGLAGAAARQLPLLQLRRQLVGSCGRLPGVGGAGGAPGADPLGEGEGEAGPLALHAVHKDFALVGLQQGVRAERDDQGGGLH
jgi:hypothetical protein